MVFVFGVDIPLVELIFVLTVVLILLFGFMIYLVIGQVKLRRKLRTVIYKENIELRDLRKLQIEERDELKLLRIIRAELDKLLYSRHLRLKAKKAEKQKPKVKKIKKVKIKKKRIPVRTIFKTVFKKPKKIYVASRDGNTLHEKNCFFAKKISPESRVIFKSKTKAFNKGYKACNCIKGIQKKRRAKKKAARMIPELPKIEKPKVRTVVKTVVKRPKKSYVASKGGNTLHEENCPFAKKIGEENKIYFRSKTKAFDEGYKACNCI